MVLKIVNYESKSIDRSSNRLYTAFIVILYVIDYFFLFCVFRSCIRKLIDSLQSIALVFVFYGSFLFSQRALNICILELEVRWQKYRNKLFRLVLKVFVYVGNKRWHYITVSAKTNLSRKQSITSFFSVQIKNMFFFVKIFVDCFFQQHKPTIVFFFN